MSVYVCVYIYIYTCVCVSGMYVCGYVCMRALMLNKQQCYVKAVLLYVRIPRIIARTFVWKKPKSRGRAILRNRKTTYASQLNPTNSKKIHRRRDHTTLMAIEDHPRKLRSLQTFRESGAWVGLIEKKMKKKRKKLARLVVARCESRYCFGLIWRE